MSMTDQRSTSALLYLSGVTVSFDGFKALNNLSLLVEPGEMRAIIGPQRCRQDHHDGRRHRQDAA
jgi:urea transport system ATP-binding protein